MSLSRALVKLQPTYIDRLHIDQAPGSTSSLHVLRVHHHAQPLGIYDESEPCSEIVSISKLQLHQSHLPVSMDEIGSGYILFWVHHSPHLTGSEAKCPWIHTA